MPAPEHPDAFTPEHLNTPRRRVLVIAYYFPPMGLSGVQRVAKFVKYLPLYGWQPTVLTVKPAGYFAYDETMLHEVEAAGVRIVRTSSLDPTRLFGGRMTVPLPPERARRWFSLVSQAFCVPDNKLGWLGPALRRGRDLLREQRFDALFSSAPPYTAHLVGAVLSRASGLPLVCDFRDDWVGNPRHVYPTPLHRRLHAALERRVVCISRHVTTINEPIREALRARNRPAPPVSVVPQGFDPADFERAPAPRDQGVMRLVHSGIFYDAQTPDGLLQAVAALVQRRPEVQGALELTFVGLVPASSRALARALGLDGMVRCTGYLPHREAVRFLQSADVLWMTVGRRPGAAGISTGKLFEYFGARKPILALVPEGAAREALRPYGAAYVAAPDDPASILRQLEALFDGWQRGRLPLPAEGYVQQFDRRVLAGALARCLSALTGPEGAASKFRYCKQ